MYLKFKNLNIGKEFICVWHLNGEAWAPLYRKTVACAVDGLTAAANSVDSIGCLVFVKEDEEVVEVR